jgi:hypothetical protein
VVALVLPAIHVSDLWQDALYRVFANAPATRILLYLVSGLAASRALLHIHRQRRKPLNLKKKPWPNFCLEAVVSALAYGLSADSSIIRSAWLLCLCLLAEASLVIEAQGNRLPKIVLRKAEGAATIPGTFAERESI